MVRVGEEEPKKTGNQDGPPCRGQPLPPSRGMEVKPVRCQASGSRVLQLGQKDQTSPPPPEITKSQLQGLGNATILLVTNVKTEPSTRYPRQPEFKTSGDSGLGQELRTE